MFVKRSGRAIRLINGRCSMAIKIPLEMIEVASPCTASWDAMRGDDRTRLCGQCDKYVYNLSELTRAEAETLVAEREGKLCVRFYLRSDATMLTADCPIGLQAVRRRGRKIALGVAALIVAIFGFMAAGLLYEERSNGELRRRVPAPIARVLDWMFPPTPACVMGVPAPMNPGADVPNPPGENEAPLP
jgi:hypothetical protein